MHFAPKTVGVTLEEGCTTLGVDDFREVAAGLGTGTLLGAVCLYPLYRNAIALLYHRAQVLRIYGQITLDGRPAHNNFRGSHRRSAPSAAVEGEV